MESNKYNRNRNITIGFRVTKAESDAINELVAISGMTKQDYCTARLLQKDIVVQRNPRVYLAMKTLMTNIYEELIRIHTSDEVSTDLRELVALVTDAYDRMKDGD